MNRLRPGQFVVSRAGRDKGHSYILLAVVDECFVLVVDGDRKRVRNPKRKNIKHLWVQHEVASGIAEKLDEGTAVTDDQIRSVLKELKERQGGG